MNSDSFRPAAIHGSQTVCHCAGVTASQIRECATGRPDLTPSDVCERLGCALQCGSCQPAVMELLGKQAWWQAQAHATKISSGCTRTETERAIYRVRLTPESHGDRAYPMARPGQHVVLRLSTGVDTVQRSFTIIAQDIDSGAIDLAVRRIPGGRLTPEIVDSDGPTSLQISAPAGAGFEVTDPRDTVFFAGGIGITPAVSLFRAMQPGARGHLHWSIAQPGDAVLSEEREEIARRHPQLAMELQDTSQHGFLTAHAIQGIAAQYPGARFFLCGPPAYLNAVKQALLAAGVREQALFIERFEVPDTAANRRSVRFSFRWKTYLAGLLLAGSTGVLLSQTPEQQRPHGHPNIGHENISCISCHGQAVGSTRQVLQAKTHHLLGLRKDSATFGREPVSNQTCMACHANYDDRHAPSRFLEPRFDQARHDTGAHQCISCHREHQGVRIAAPRADYCISCHSDLNLHQDPARPTHVQLIREKRWDTCLQCHDYHGNHRGKAPLRLEDGIAIERIHAYFRKEPSPYGETLIKAMKED